MEEIWKDIKWWEWYYQVSNLWRVKSLSRIWWLTKRSKWTKERILKPLLWSNWYLSVMLCKNCRMYNNRIHRLVASHFNCWFGSEVNHIDWNKLNNSASNLERCDKSHNLKHAYRIWLKQWFWTWKILDKCPNSKPVIQYSIDMVVIKEWHSATEVWNILWYQRTAIQQCCRWQTRKSYWYIRKYQRKE